MLGWIYGKWDGGGTDSIDLAQHNGRVAGACKRGNISGSIKRGEFFKRFEPVRFSKGILLHEVSK